MKGQSNFPVIVVGAGIIGASIALQLARRDVAVLLLDRHGPAAGISGRSFGWINALQTQDEDYLLLRLESLREYRRLHERYPDDIRPASKGSLLWHLPATDLEAICAELDSPRYPLRMISRTEILELEPGLSQAPDYAAFVEADSSIDPRQATQRFINLAIAHGARFEQNCQVSRLLADDNKVHGLETSIGRISSDLVIIAAGQDTAELCKSVDVEIPLQQSAGLILRTQAIAPHTLHRIVQTPDLRMWQGNDGRIIACIDVDEPGSGEDTDRLVTDLTHKIEDVLNASIEVDSAIVSYRTIPKGGRPIVGRAGNIGGISVAVMHSGITLAPIIGRLVAEGVISGRAHPTLRAFSPDRFSPKPVSRA